MRAMQGMRGEPAKKSGKVFEEEVKEEVKRFFRSDEISRQLPGTRDKSKERNADGSFNNKRLLLLTLSEAHTQFLTTYSDRGYDPGFTVFYSFLPKDVYPLSKLNHHNVCVCVKHENVKLMCQWLGLYGDKYLDFLKIRVCDVTRKLCMFLRCETCQQNEHALENAIREKVESKSHIKFKRWETTDRGSIEQIIMDADSFIHKLVALITSLCKHHFLTKKQQGYLHHCKNTLTSEEAIVIADFSENYTPCFQDEIQSVHFRKGEHSSTLHPFFMYTKGIVQDDEITHHDQIRLTTNSVVVISNCLDHSTNVFHCFLNKFIAQIKLSMPHIKKLIFFTDGCAAQYKNFKMTMNVAFFKQDFGMEFEMNYFASSHGKGPSDGVGGVVKRMARDASLREELIGNPMEFFAFVDKNVKSVKAIWVSRMEVEEHVESYKLNERYSLGQTIPGSTQLHKIIPIQPGSGVKMYECSDDELPTVVKIFQGEEGKYVNVTPLSIGQWFACVYESAVYFAKMKDFDEGQDEAFVQFVHRVKPGVYVSRKGDEAWVPVGRFLLKIYLPKQGRRNQLRIDESALHQAESLFNAFKQL